MRTWPSVAVLLLAGTLLASCGDGSPSEPAPAPPIPGWLKVRMTSPQQDDGGILFALSGGPIESVRTSYPELLTSEGALPPKRVLVVGDLTSGSVVAEILVPDVRKVADYRATVEQVASRASFQQRGTPDYRLTVER
jgi:hypothetical protein